MNAPNAASPDAPLGAPTPLSSGADAATPFVVAPSAASPDAPLGVSTPLSSGVDATPPLDAPSAASGAAVNADVKSPASDRAMQWYLGGSVGWVGASNACEVQATGCDNNDMGAGAFVGLTLNDWLAVQVGYDYLGKIHADYPALNHASINAPYQSKTQGLELVLKPYWQVTDNASLYVKAGTLGWRMEVTGQEVDFTHEASDSGWSPLVGVGGEWALSTRWSTFAEYQWVYHVGGDDTGGADMNMVNVGLRYRFADDKDEPVPVAAPAPTLVVTPITAADPIPTRAPDWSFSGASFAFDSHELTTLARDHLSVALAKLNAHPQMQLMIVGHTDSAGRTAYNQTLSEARAHAVEAYFLEHGIASSRLNARGMGERMPIADNHTAAGREKNRRIDLFVHDASAHPQSSLLNQHKDIF